MLDRNEASDSTLPAISFQRKIVGAIPVFLRSVAGRGLSLLPGSPVHVNRPICRAKIALTNERRVNDMDQALLRRLQEAAESSIKDPGKNRQELPKASPRPGQNYVVVFRHGESEDNFNRIFSGWRDVRITTRGREQASALAPKLKQLELDVAITSDLVRSKETARLALAENPGVRFEEDSRIKERNYGVLTGTSKEDLMRKDPQKATLWRRGYDVPPPEGESIQMVEQRVWPFLDELVARIKKERINVALSVHGNSMRAVRRYFEKMDETEAVTHENPLGTDYALYVVT